MNLLFLDTETTGLWPIDSQIIEISAIVATFDINSFELKIVSSFSELVKLRQALDSKTTRITGLDEIELVNAKRIDLVQQSWVNWLEEYEIEAIVGHSINFDIGFLKNESWYLPKAKLIDTVDLSSIILPQAKAVNLEYLITYFDISVESSNIAIDKSALKPHRALYDSISAMILFSKLLDKIASSESNPQILKILEKTFINLGINFYSKNEYFDYSYQYQQPPIKVNLDGSLKNQSLYEKSKKQLDKLSQKLLVDLIQEKWESYQLRSILSYYFICLSLSKNLNDFKIHLREPKDFGFLDIIVDFISSKSTKQANEQKFETIEIEGIFSQIKTISNTNLNVSKIINLCEALNCLVKTNSLENTSFIDSFISSYDFLLLAINSTNKIFSDIEDPILRSKKISFLENFENFKAKIICFNPILSNQNEVIKDLIDFIKKELVEKIGFVEKISANDEFGVFSNQLTISSPIKNFSIRESFHKLSTSYPQLVYKTYLYNKDDLENLLKFYSLQLDIDKIDILSTRFKTNYHQSINLTETLGELVDKSKVKACPLILCGQNSTLAAIQKIATTNFNPHQYAVLGESGSLSKIISKLFQSFNGVVATKFNDYEFIANQNTSKLISEIWVINEPYIFVNAYWNSKNKDDIIKVKRIIRNAYINKIKVKFEKDVNFVGSF